MKIAVYGICKNESKHIDRFVQSCEGADIISILDTGSDDDSVIRMKDRGVSVVQRTISPWRFDVARNMSLNLLPEDVDICISLDIDETLSANWRDVVESVWCYGVTRLSHKMVSGGRSYTEHRIHSRNGYYWKNAIHEVLTSTIHENCVYADLEITHQPDLKKARSFYSDLLEIVRNEDPTNLRNYCYIAIDKIARGLSSSVSDIVDEALKNSSAWHIEKSYIAMLAAYAEETFEGANEEYWLLRSIASAPDWREPWFKYGKFLLKRNRFVDANEALKKALKLNERIHVNYSDSEAWGAEIFLISANAAMLAYDIPHARVISGKASKIFPLDKRVTKLREDLQK